MQLTKLANLTKENIIFHELKEYKIKNSKMKYHRMKIETKYDDNKQGPLVIESPFLFSFGVSERKNQESDEIVGYSLPVCLWSKESQPTSEEAMFFNKINDLTDICKHHL